MAVFFAKTLHFKYFIQYSYLFTIHRLMNGGIFAEKPYISNILFSTLIYPP